MNKFSINDWLTIQTRKDLTYIRRSLEHKYINFAIFADLFIAVFAFALDHILWRVEDPLTGAVEQAAPSWFWIIIAVFLVLIPGVILLVNYNKRNQYQADVKKVMPVDDLVDLFDNEVCYNIMAADSMRDHMLDEDDNLEDEIQKFYFIEASYYVNKVVTQLFYCKNQGKQAIETKKNLGGISAERFQNVCEIVRNIYLDLIGFSEGDEEYQRLFDESEDYVYNFNELIKYMDTCVEELDFPKEWKVEIPWKKKAGEENG